jgi:hypothetical protein
MQCLVVLAINSFSGIWSHEICCAQWTLIYRFLGYHGNYFPQGAATANSSALVAAEPEASSS